jgi:tripartite-type tricarboxylate transporter receptor subunit TctC
MGEVGFAQRGPSEDPANLLFCAHGIDLVRKLPAGRAEVLLLSGTADTVGDEHSEIDSDSPAEFRRGTIMKPSRRQFLRLAGVAAVLSAESRNARAQTFPTRPVRIIVGFTAGGAFDIIARTMGQWLSERLGQQFVIENRPGAASNTATEAVVRAPADGYTLLLGGAVNTVNATLYDKLNFDFIRDIAPVAGIIRFSNVMQVNPSFPTKTVPEFIAYAKANPGKINMASGGSGTTQHLAGELFKMMTGVNMVHVPYRGSALSLTDLLGGQVQVTFDPIPASIEHIRAGRLRALAVTTAMRSEVLPEVPTVGEFVPGYEASGWAGIGAPRGTPTEIVGKLNREINAGLADPTIKSRLGNLGGVTLVLSPTEFGTLIAAETEKWGKVVKAAGIKPD